MGKKSNSIPARSKPIFCIGGILFILDSVRTHCAPPNILPHAIRCFFVWEDRPIIKLFRLLLALAAFASSADAQTLPPPVMPARKEAIEACEPGKVTFGPNYIQTADFNGDGELDYVLDDGGLECKGANAVNDRGTGGCAIEVYVSTPQGYRSAELQYLAFKASIVRKAGKPPILVLVGRHGTDRYRWNDEALNCYEQGLAWSSQPLTHS